MLAGLNVHRKVYINRFEFDDYQIEIDKREIEGRRIDGRGRY